jgi:hypothetical protein
MNTIGRLVISDRGDEPRLILGMIFSGASTGLKPNVVYEIIEIMGEIILKPLGKSAIRQFVNSPNNNTGICWSNDVNSIVYNGSHLVTGKELLEESNFGIGKRPEYIQELIDKCYRLISEGDMEFAKEGVQLLSDHLGEDDAQIVELNALIFLHPKDEQTNLIIYKSSRCVGSELKSYEGWAWEEAKIEHLRKDQYLADEIDLVTNICAQLTNVNPVGFKFCTVAEAIADQED